MFATQDAQVIPVTLTKHFWVLTSRLCVLVPSLKVVLWDGVESEPGEFSPL